MPSSFCAAVLILAAVVGLLWAEDPTKSGAVPTTDDLAKHLVIKVARVNQHDLVLISGKGDDAPLIESLEIECSATGADSLILHTLGDASYRRSFSIVPENFDQRRRVLMEHLAEVATVTFNMDYMDSSVNADLPPRRIQARSEANRPVVEKMLKRNVRQIYIGNGLYPIDSHAKEIGLTKEEMASLFRSGLAADPNKIAAAGAKVKAKLESGNQVRVVCPNGTDMKLGVAKRRVTITDGVLSDDKLKAGGVACQLWLPAGEAYLVPVPGSVNGKLVMNQWVWEGKEINDLSFTFRNGKMVEMTAKPSPAFVRLQAAYQVAVAGKEELGALDVGLNPNVKMPDKSKEGVYMAAGTITFAIGGNLWAGGENKCPFGMSLMVRDATMTVDGAELVKNGTLNLD